ncbi:hypothetical protein B0X78_20760 [bacterium AM6]|nr:hypothetical protein B0X78_20760 [bacterium AM6]
MVRTDVLGDAAGFAGGDLGATDVIQQRGLAVIDVTMMVTTGGRCTASPWFSPADASSASSASLSLARIAL